MNKEEALNIISEMEEIISDSLGGQDDYLRDIQKDIKRLKRYLKENLK